MADDLRNQQPVVIDGVHYKGLDVRGWHGHTVLAGSKHKSGSRYRWIDGCSPDEIPLAECPASWWAWLPKKEFGESAIKSTRTFTPSARRARGAVRHSGPASNLIGDGPGHGGFNRPIRSRCCQFFARFGTHADATAFKAVLREVILKADARNHTPQEIARYASDDYLEAELASAREFIRKAWTG